MKNPILIIIRGSLSRNLRGFLAKGMLWLMSKSKVAAFLLGLFGFLYWGRRIKKVNEVKEGKGIISVTTSQHWLVFRENWTCVFDGMHNWLFKPEKGDIFIDVGAYVGVFTLEGAEAVGETGSVVAVEPEPRNGDLLLKNIETNGIKNATLVTKAIGDEKGRAKLYLSPHSASHSIAQRVGDNYIEVDVDTLDNLVSELGLKRVDFIKIDTEGSELEVLKGATNILGKLNVRLAIEATHTLANGEPGFPEVLAYLKAKGAKTCVKGDYIFAETV